MVFYTLDDQHIVGLFEQGLEHVQERDRRRRAAQRGAHDRDLHRLRAARRVDLQGRGDGLPRRGGAASSGASRTCRPRGLLGRPDRPAAARQVRRREAVGRRRSPPPSPTPGMRAWLEHEEPIAPATPRRGAQRRCSSRLGRLLAAGLAGRCSAGRGARRSRCCSPLSIAAGVPLTVAQGLARAARCASLDINVLMLVAAAGAIAARRVVRGRRGRLPVRRRAGARGADAGARAERGPRADGSDAGRGAGARRRRRAAGRRRRRSRRAR